MGQCPDSIKRLINRFTQQADQLHSPDYNETQLRVDYVNPLMSELGWDIDNRQGFAERYREVVHEDRVRVGGQTKAPDYSFRVGGQRKFFLEAKKPSVDINNSWEPAYQLRRYAWSAKLASSLLTNFEEFAIYDTRIQPKQLEKASVARRDYIRYTDYPDRWDFISGTFSKDAVLRGEFDRYCESKKGRGAQLFDDAFLSEIEEWRKSIAGSLARNNDNLDESSLNFAVQRIIDRIIFLRIAEDRGTETVGQLQALLGGESVYPRLCKLFRDADARYNSGLFHFAKEKDRDEAPDTLTPALNVDDKTLKGIIKALYYPQSPYEFTMVSADILGSVYERFLGKVITLTAGHHAKIEEKPEVRKAGGVYYTPTYIVDYIVKNTVGKLLERKSPKEAARITVLDPACGSGSFLIGAYQFLLDWYHAQYTTGTPEALASGKKPVLRPGRAGGWALTIAERKRILLDHIHGVDLDGQAVEVTKLNLLLKCLEGETSQTLGFGERLFRERALPDLGRNILCGNSLIGTDIIGTEAWDGMNEEEQARINPFDFDRAFVSAYSGPVGYRGFDVVIGNPPYVLAQSMDNPNIFKFFSNNFEAARYKIDTYHLFMERGLRETRKGGFLGYIVPNTFLRNRHAIELRRLILSLSSPLLLRLFDYNVFDASVDTAILVTRRGENYTTVVEVVRSSGTGESSVSSLPISEWRSHPKLEFLISAGSSGSAITAKMQSSGVAIGSFATAYFGIQTHDRAKFVARTRVSASFRPAIDGGNISRYSLSPAIEFVNFEPQAIKSGGNPTVYAKERIGVRQIGRVPVATLLPAGLLTLNTIYNIHIIRESPYDLRMVLGVLSSRAGRYFWLTRFFDQKKTFPKVKKPDLLNVPMPLADKNTEGLSKLSSSVDLLLSMHKRLIAEALPRRREQIQREIDATDRQIDQLMYQLYGLTDEEIKIVEEATH